MPTGPTDRARDRELLARVARGDVAALRTLYDQHAPRAITIAYRILRNREEAEDVVQETFLEVWRRAPSSIPAAAAPSPGWSPSRAAAPSTACARGRIAGRTIASASEDADGLLPVPPPSPALETERRRDERRVAAALGALPAAQRRTIELAYFEGLSQSEIAAKTASPLGTVKMRVKLAMAKLADAAGGRKHMIHRHQMTLRALRRIWRTPSRWRARGARAAGLRPAHHAGGASGRAAARRSAAAQGVMDLLAAGAARRCAAARAVARRSRRAWAAEPVQATPNGCDWKVSSTSVCRRRRTSTQAEQRADRAGDEVADDGRPAHRAADERSAR